MNSKSLSRPHAQLWIGNHNNLCEKAETFLQKQFCKNDGCGVCTICRQIRIKQFHNAIWIYPEKRYTLDAIKVIFETMAYKLGPEEKLFFIIQKADSLTAACSNSLLKPVEEPPAGYHFIFLAERKDLVLPTIRSRCTIRTYLSKEDNQPEHRLLDYIISNKQPDASEFSKYLSSAKLNERESAEILDKILIYWMNKAKDAIKENKSKELEEATQKIDIIKKSLRKSIMPGSTTIFWKNLFMNIYAD